MIYDIIKTLVWGSCQTPNELTKYPNMEVLKYMAKRIISQPEPAYWTDDRIVRSLNAGYEGDYARYVELEEEAAREIRDVGYMARMMVMVSLPHSRVPGNEYTRTNGDYQLTILAPSHVGLPYGVKPRLILLWITTEAVRKQQRQLFLGCSLSDFMCALGLLRTGGARGDITGLKNQMRRLISSSISVTYNNGKNWALEHITPIQKANLFWAPANPDQLSLWESTITLSEGFYNEIVNHRIPIKMSTLKELRNSSFALDIYTWLSYKNYCSRPGSRIPIPWESLQLQLGAGYPRTAEGKRDFKVKFCKALKKVAKEYPEANKLVAETKHLIYVKGDPDVSPRNKLFFGGASVAHDLDKATALAREAEEHRPALDFK